MKYKAIYTEKPCLLKALHEKEMTLNYQEFQVKWLNYVKEYSKGIDI